MELLDAGGARSGLVIQRSGPRPARSCSRREPYRRQIGARTVAHPGHRRRMPAHLWHRDRNGPCVVCRSQPMPGPAQSPPGDFTAAGVLVWPSQAPRTCTFAREMCRSRRGRTGCLVQSGWGLYRRVCLDKLELAAVGAPKPVCRLGALIATCPDCSERFGYVDAWALSL